MAKLTYTGAEVQALLDKVNDLANLTGAVTIEGEQAIEGLKDFLNGFKIGGALVKYDPAKKCFIFTENVLFEKGMAWNSRFGDFTDEEIFSITKAVDVDWKTIGKNAAGQLYVINGGGEGGGGNYDPDFLYNYLTNNNYITESALTPYAKTADVNSLLTGYLSKSGGTVNGNITATTFIGALQGTADNANSVGGVGANRLIQHTKIGNYVAARFVDQELAVIAADTFIEYYGAGNWLNSKWGKITAVNGFIGNLTGNADSATKLSTPRTLWGQSFDGTNNVYGNIFPEESEGCYYHEGGISYHKGKVFVANILRATPDCNVAIGGSTATEKLHVHGNAKVDGYVNINGKPISYNASKNTFVLQGNLLIEGGMAWNSKIDGFDVPTITDAVSIDGTSIIRDGGVLRVNPDYIQSVGGLNENELASYLTNNKYITQPTLADTLTPYAKTADVNSLLTEYLPKSSISDWALQSTPPAIKFERLTNLDSATPWTAFYTSFQPLNRPEGANFFTGITFTNTDVVVNNPSYNVQLALTYDGAIYTRYRTQNIYDSWRRVAFLSEMPTKLSQLTDDVVAGNYLSTLGGTVNGNITATKFIGALEGDAESVGGVGANRLIQHTKIGNYVAARFVDQELAVIAADTFIEYYGAGNWLNSKWGKITAVNGFIGNLTGNADSATKLSTPRTLWGQSFDGTSDVNGDLISTGNVSAQTLIAKGNFGLRFSYGSIGSMLYSDGSRFYLMFTNEGDAQGSFNSLRPFMADKATGDTYLSNYALNVYAEGKVAVNGITAEEALHVHGNILATGRIAWNSSRVLKNIIGERYLTLDELAQIKPYRYKWKDGRDDLVHVGAIADEVMEIMPETVLTDSLGIHSMDYAQTAFVMAASLSPHVSDHERRIKDLELENEALREEIAKLKNVA